MTNDYILEIQTNAVVYCLCNFVGLGNEFMKKRISDRGLCYCVVINVKEFTCVMEWNGIDKGYHSEGHKDHINFPRIQLKLIGTYFLGQW